MKAEDPRRSAPAALRNRDPILRVLRDVLPESGTVLELASGSGEHAMHFARALGGLSWQPSDPASDARASIRAWLETEGPANLLPPMDIDATAASWPIARADAIVCINMVHISPWEATEGLMQGAGRILPAGAPLVLYGPYRRGDRALEPSNAAFDADLRRRDPRWGLREIAEVAACGQGHGLAMERIVEMPANNLMLIFRRNRTDRPG